MRPFPRRRVLQLGPAALLFAPIIARAGLTPPGFDAWVGRTALLHTASAPARLFLAPDGTGALSVRLGFRWSVALRRWRIGQGGLVLDYVRHAVLDPERRIEGRAVINAAAACVLWQDDGRAPRSAELLGFEPGDATKRL